jgi:hypothetical protein
VAGHLAIVSVIFVPLEQLFPLHPQKAFRKYIAVDLGYYFLVGLSSGLMEPRSPSSPARPGTWCQTRSWRRS